MSYEIECPVCDRKSSSSASVCPYCGSDLSMASFDDLEEVAQALASGKPQPAKPAAKAEPIPEPPPMKEVEAPRRQEEPKPVAQPPETQAAHTEEQAVPERAKEEDKKDDEGKKGLGRLFGRKKK